MSGEDHTTENPLPPAWMRDLPPMPGSTREREMLIAELAALRALNAEYEDALGKAEGVLRLYARNPGDPMIFNNDPRWATDAVAEISAILTRTTSKTTERGVTDEREPD